MLFHIFKGHLYIFGLSLQIFCPFFKKSGFVGFFFPPSQVLNTVGEFCLLPAVYVTNIKIFILNCISVFQNTETVFHRNSGLLNYEGVRCRKFCCILICTISLLYDSFKFSILLFLHPERE